MIKSFNSNSIYRIEGDSSGSPLFFMSNLSFMIRDLVIEEFLSTLMIQYLILLE